MFFALQILDALGNGHPQIFAACGRGTRSSLRVVQHGLTVEELADNELPGTPLAVWTLKTSNEAQHDGYIVVTFPDSTLILSIGENVTEVTDTNFLQNAPSIHLSLMADDSHIQVYLSVYSSRSLYILLILMMLLLFYWFFCEKRRRLFLVLCINKYVCIYNIYINNTNLFLCLSVDSR